MKDICEFRCTEARFPSDGVDECLLVDGVDVPSATVYGQMFVLLHTHAVHVEPALETFVRHHVFAANVDDLQGVCGGQMKNYVNVNVNKSYVTL